MGEYALNSLEEGTHRFASRVIFITYDCIHHVEQCIDDKEASIDNWVKYEPTDK